MSPSDPNLSAAPDLPLDLQPLLRPRSVAIVGASSDPRSFGGFVLGNLRRFGFPGAIHPVSRSSASIDGLPCVASVEALPADLDLAVLAIPQAGVLEAVQQLADRGCKAAVLFASGYAETGDEGRERQEALARLARHHGMRLLGPNCMGYTNDAHAAAVTFEPLEPCPTEGRPGVGVLAQSGAMAANLRDALRSRGLVVPCVCSTGNEASVTVEDVLAHYLDDPSIRLVAMYAEQIRRPALFLALARCARQRGKPIVLLMPGRSARAREAAASHTGALAGDHATATVALRREAVVCVDSLDELFDATAVLLSHPAPSAGGTAFVTGSGAVKNLALDFADDVGLAMPPLAEPTVQALRALLPDYAVAENPLDYTTIGVRQPGLIAELIHAMLADPGVGNAVLAIPVGPRIAQRDKADHIVPALARADKPVVLVLTGDASPIEPFFEEAIRASGVPLFRSLDRALRAMRQVVGYGQALAAAARADAVADSVGDLVGDSVAVQWPEVPPPHAPTGGDKPSPVGHAASPPGEVVVVPEHQGKVWLRQRGVPVPDGRLARDLDDALAIARRLGGPVVLKAQAASLAHKSDVGGVVVGLRDEAALRAGWPRLLAQVGAHRPDLVAPDGGLRGDMDGVLVEAMGAPGLELVVGARRDPQWGPVLLVGLGGVWIEVLRDAQLLPADAAMADIVSALRGLKAAAVLDGVRGQPAVDVSAVAQVVATIGQAMRADASIAEIDINPLVARPDGVCALDILIIRRPIGCAGEGA